jgi:hypothetical protein
MPIKIDVNVYQYKGGRLCLGDGSATSHFSAAVFPA